MKKSAYYLLLLSGLFFLGCNKSNTDGNVKGYIIKDELKHTIGKEGGELSIKISDKYFWYSAFSITTAEGAVYYDAEYFDSNNPSRYDVVEIDGIKLWVEGEKLKVLINPNDFNSPKIINMTLQAANLFNSLTIEQSAE